MKDCVDIFIFADALGWKLVRERDYLADLFPIRNPCETLFGYSATCDPTILTGVPPVEHGHFSFFVKAGEERPFRHLGLFGFLPQKIAGHHRIRNKVSRYVAKRKGYTGYFQLYSVPFNKLPYLDYTEKRDIYEPGGIIGGQPSIFEHWTATGKHWIRSDWRAGDTANIMQAKQRLDEGDVDLVYLFTAGLDAVMHRYGPESPRIDAAFEAFAKQVRDLHAIASRRYREARFHIFSDHGMATVSTDSTMLKRWERAGFTYGRDYLAVWDSTMARFWFLDEKAQPDIEAWLGEQPDGRLLDDAQLKAWGCLFPDRRYGERFYLLPTGSLFVPSFLNMGHVNGMHGYDPGDSESTASWLATHETAPVKKLTDIFPVMKAASDA